MRAAFVTASPSDHALLNLRSSCQHVQGQASCSYLTSEPSVNASICVEIEYMKAMHVGPGPSGFWEPCNCAFACSAARAEV